MLTPALRAVCLVVLLACGCGGAAVAADVTIAGGPAVVTLGAAQLAALPAVEVVYRDHTYTGVRLRDVFTKHGVPQGKPMTAVGADGYSKQLPVDVLGRDDAILAYAVDGGPLRPEEGGLRLVVPNSPGLSVKQLVRLGP